MGIQGTAEHVQYVLVRVLCSYMSGTEVVLTHNLGLTGLVIINILSRQILTIVFQMHSFCLNDAFLRTLIFVIFTKTCFSHRHNG